MAASSAADRVAELSLARERAAMANEDARSYVAQRHFVGSLQVPRDDGDAPMTWQEAYERQAVAAMRAAARANQARDAPAVERALREQIGSDSEDEEDMGEEQLAEEDVEMSAEPFSGAAHRLDPPALVPFSGTGRRIA